MKVLFKYFLLLIIFLFLTNCLKDKSIKKEKEKINICIVKYIYGKSYKINETDNSQTALTAGDNLYENDIIKTEVKSILEIMISDKSIIRLNENTKIKMITLFKDQSSANTKINLDAGKIYAKPEELNPGSNFEIETKSITTGVRGTEFIVYIPQDSDRVIITVNEGTVSIKKNIQLNSSDIQKIKDINPKYAKKIIDNIYTELILNKNEKTEISQSKIDDLKIEINNKISNIANELELSKNSDQKTDDIINKNENEINNLKLKSDQLIQKDTLSDKEWELNLIKAEEKNNKIIKETKKEEIKKDLKKEEKTVENQIFVDKLVKLPGELFTNLSEKFSAVTTDGKFIYVINDIDNTLYCINPANGYINWKFRHDKLTKIQSPAVANNNVIIISTYTDIFVINKNGNLISQKEITNGTSYWACPVLFNNTILIPTSRTIYYYDNSLDSLSEKELNPSNSQIYISEDNKFIYAVDSLNKKAFVYDFINRSTIWTSDKINNIVLTAPVWTGKYLIIADSVNSIYKFDIAADDNPEILKIPSGVLSNLIIYNNNIYYAANNGWLYRISVNSFNAAVKIAQIDFKPEQDKYLVKKLSYLNDHIYFASDSGSLFDYDLKSYKSEFIKSDNDSNTPLIGSPVIINDLLYTIDINSNIYMKKKEPKK